MNEGWYALCVAILKDVPPEAAFEMMRGTTYKHKIRDYITDKDVEDMIELKKECTYQEIGEMYGICRTAVLRRIKRYLAQGEIA